jgi:DNA-directed RNA polymerase specialized sigma24 family protein
MRLSKDGECRNKSRTRFFQTYQPLLFVFFRRKGVGEHDAEDLASDLLAKLLGMSAALWHGATFSGWPGPQRGSRIADRGKR